MIPLLTENDQLDIDFYSSPKDISTQKRGDIVVIRNDSEWILHRVVEKNHQLWTKGDWNQQIDCKTQVWGQLSQVNGCKAKPLFWHFFSFCSEHISSQSHPLKRKFFRIVLLIFGRIARILFIRKPRGLNHR